MKPRRKMRQPRRKMRHLMGLNKKREGIVQVHNLEEMDRLSSGDRMRVILNGVNERQRRATIGTENVSSEYIILIKCTHGESPTPVNYWKTDSEGLIFRARGVVEFDADRTTPGEYLKGTEAYNRAMDLIDEGRI